MNSKLDMWIISNAKYFPAEKMPLIQEKLQYFPEAKINLLYSTELKDPTVILMISIFIGVFGIDRFVLGDVGLGVAKLLTGGGCGIWAIIDIFFTYKKSKEVNFISVMETMDQFRYQYEN
jgi:hypothetical protein